MKTLMVDNLPLRVENMPLRKTMCATCPFREGSEYAELRKGIMISALTNGRVCHATGSNAIHRRTGLPPHLCRGARDFQLQLMASLNFIAEPTDAAWNEKRVELGMTPTLVLDPKGNDDDHPL